MRRLLAALALAEVADVTTTYFLLARGGHEGNPAVAALLIAGGFAGFVAFKAGAWIVCAYIALTWPSAWIRAAILVGIAIMSVFVFNNLLGD